MTWADSTQVGWNRNTVCDWVKSKNVFVSEMCTLVVSTLWKLETKVMGQLSAKKSAALGQMARLNGGRVDSVYLKAI